MLKCTVSCRSFRLGEFLGALNVGSKHRIGEKELSSVESACFTQVNTEMVFTSGKYTKYSKGTVEF